MNESSVVMDSTVRAMDFQELHASVLAEAPSGGESHIIASSESRATTHTRLSLLGSEGKSVSVKKLDL